VLIRVPLGPHLLLLVPWDLDHPCRPPAEGVPRIVTSDGCFWFLGDESLGMELRSSASLPGSTDRRACTSALPVQIHIQVFWAIGSVCLLSALVMA